VRIYDRALSEDEIKALAGVKTGPATSFEYDLLGRLITRTDGAPETTDDIPVTHYHYDAAGRMVSMTDALGQTTTYTYDRLGRQVQVTLPDPDGPDRL